MIYSIYTEHTEHKCTMKTTIQCHGGEGLEQKWHNLTYIYKSVPREDNEQA